MKNLVEIGNNILPVIAYGDSVGLPFEKKPAEQIGKVWALQAIETNPFLGEHPLGTTSDDTHLSLAVALSLIQNSGYDIGSIAEWHIMALRHVQGAQINTDLIPAIVTDKNNSGWGGSTTKSVERLVQGINPTESGEESGAGNGVLMKMAPLAYWQLANKVDDSECDRQITEFTKMTHNNPVAVVASLTHLKILHRLMLKEASSFNGEQFLLSATNIAINYEKLLEVEPVLSKKLSSLYKIKQERNLISEDIKQVAPKGGFYAPETLAIVYGSFVSENTFPNIVYRTVELGGDTDSTASIAGTMALFLHGTIDKPQDFSETFEFQRLCKISHRLAKIALT